MPANEFIVIPDTTFDMGSQEGADDERPLHRVTVNKFAIGRVQVTNAHWAVFLGARGLAPPAFWSDSNFNLPEQPVVAVSWFDAVEYCQWRSEATGTQIRLPTEAEWECAARGGLEGKHHPWGDEPLPDDGRWASGPARTGLDTPNGYGLHDFCTNAHEWCSDWYGAGYYLQSPAHNPTGPDNGTRRVSRGGSWRHQVKVTRCAARSSIPPEYRYADYGFRVACDIPR
jgi:sulfatase modifying factor 1